MVYRFAQWIGRIALHWFYRAIVVVHRDRVPLRGPMLVAVNHHNAMVDAIVAQWVVPRPLRITAKATLSSNVFGALFVKATGIIPLRRRSDAPPGRHDPASNRGAFRAVIHALRHDSAVLIFPEGKSHNDPVVAPLKRGLASMALRARAAGVRGIHIVPIGLTFEDKSRPDTVVVAQVGEVLALDDWPLDDPEVLTSDIAERLHRVAMTADVQRLAAGGQHPSARPLLITLLAWWGRVIHKIPIDLARRLAITRSADADQPAMYTMIYGLAFTLVAYAIQIPVVWKLFGGVAALVYAVLLVTGAYWAAYAPHSGPEGEISVG